MKYRDINIIEFRKSILSPLTRVKTYSFQPNKTLIYLDNTNSLLAHPYIQYIDSANTLIFSLAPFTLQNKNTISLYNIVLDQLSSNSIDIECDRCKAFLLNGNSILIVDNITKQPLKIAIGSYSKGIEIQDIDPSISLSLEALYPFYEFSYLTSSTNNLIYKVTFKHDSLDIKEFIKCKNIKNAVYGKNKVTICSNDPDNLLLITNGIYSTEYSIQKNTEDVKPIDIKIFTNSIYIKFDTIGGFIFKKDGDITRIGLSREFEPLGIFEDGNIIGITHDTLSIVNIEKNSITTIAKINTNNLIDLYIDEYNNRISATYKDHITLFDINEKPIFIEIPCIKPLHSIPIDNYLIVFLQNEIRIYLIDKTSNRIYFEHIATLPRNLIHCTGVSRTNIICIDRIGRFILANVEKLIKLLNSLSSIKIIRSHHSNISTVLAPDYMPITPIKFGYHQNIDYKVHRLDSFKAIIMINHEETKIKETSMEIDGVFSHINTTIKLDDNTRIIDSYRNIKILHKINVMNTEYLFLDPPLNSNTIVIPLANIRDVKVVKPSIIKISKDRNSLRCVVAIAKELKGVRFGMLMENSDNNNITDISNIVKMFSNRICIEKLDLIEAKIFCSNSIHTLKSGCIALDKCHNLLAIHLVIHIDGNSIEIPLPLDKFVKARNIYYEDKPSLNLLHTNEFIITIPTTCISIDNPMIIFEENSIIFSIRLTNKCNNIYINILTSKNNSYLLSPQESKAINIKIDINTLIRGYEYLAIIEPGGNKILLFNIPLDYIIALSTKTALKMLNLLGLKH
ncbi:hypothetical protein Igag_1269 [Ignisphaera aggregans DSM 17230]|uniref:Uncharacterized protein n=1 Tax=Ignisphaera aggregans (strain DSM 17230 / JCM 13409 / AQ1.S1) TaxID=583356 RepID=E0SPL9_IGNAA|nr:hypothetical protein Igag_1269 [Ignisphaera aggregans DSM 17230]